MRRVHKRMRFEVAVLDGEMRNGPPANRLHDAMTLATFRALVDDLPGLRQLTLEGAGEPLLVPTVVEMIRYATSRGAEVTIESNGTLLYRDRAEELVDAKLHCLRVVTDGASPNDYDEEVNFGPVLENLAGLTAARRAAGELSPPAVRVVLIATARNILQLPDVVALLGGMWVDEVQVRLPIHRWVRARWRCLSCGEEWADPCDCACHAKPDLDLTLAAKVFAEAELIAKDYGLPLRLFEPGDEDATPLVFRGGVVP